MNDMLKIAVLFIMTISLLLGDSNENQIKLNTNSVNKTLQDDQQRKIFNSQIQDRESVKENKIYNMKEINIEEDKTENSCIQIEKINITDTTIYDSDDFEDLIAPYLNNCNGLKNLKNLTNKISNMYIDKGYITSRAFIKGQDLSDGTVDISVLEGKIEDVISENINTSNIYSGFKEKILNIRDLEVAIQQAERLKSQNVNLKLVPGNKTGYTVVHIISEKASAPYYGNVYTNNFGSDKTGNYQLGGSFNYENLFDLNDIITIRLNSTNNLAKSNDNMLGNSLSYSIPYGRSLFNLAYSSSTFKQENKDEFNDSFQSDGKSSNLLLGIDYKLFHSQSHTLEVNAGFEKKSTENTLDDVKLELQSYELSVVNLGVKHSYISNTYNYYALFNIYKGLSSFGAKNNFADQESDFMKYVLDLNYTKYFDSQSAIRYNFALRGQYSNNYLYGTEEISMGGPYSVRGFNDAGLSGNTGLYIRNELSSTYKISTYIINPYVGLDYGYVTKNDWNVDGSIVGGTLGFRTSYNAFDLDLFYSLPLKEAELIRNENKNFFGFTLSYNF